MAVDSRPNRSSTELSKLSPRQQRELLSKLLREKAERARKFPMSASQQGLWHAYQRDPEDTHYNVFLPLRVRSRLDLSALQRSIELIVSRHASLRTVFCVENEQLLQRVSADLKPVFEHHVLSGYDDQKVRSFLERESQRPFDLETGPLLRLIVCEVAEDDWVLLAIAHHIVVDFWSLVLILDELRAAYPAFRQKGTPELPPAVNNYREFVEQQRQLLDSPRGQQMREYWQQEIENASPMVEFPTDRIRPQRFSGRAGNVPMRFSPDIVRRIRQLASRGKATTSAVVQAGLQVLISRYTGHNCFLLGCPFSGRSQRKYESSVGFFVNMLPLKADLTDDPSFLQLVERTMVRLQGALENEAYPFSAIVANSGLPRDTSRTPLFQISCTFEKAHVASELGRASFLLPGQSKTLEFAGTRQEAFYLTHPTCRYDLEFIFEQTAAELRGMICYASDLFDPPSVQAFADNFGALLTSLLADPDKPISHVPWRVRSYEPREASPSHLSEDSDQQTASENFQAEVRLETVDRLILRSKPSSRLALQSHTACYTYDDLHQQSDRLARGLRAVGVRRGVIAPVIAAKGPTAFVLMLAVHRAGGAILPLDSSRLHDLEYQLADTQAPLIVVEDEQLKTRLSNTQVPVFTRDELARLPESDSADPLPSNDPNDLAYVIYTSGSTGKPKGVLITHRSICNTLHWRMGLAPLEEQDRLLMLLSHQFDACLANGWTTLAQAATVVWADPASDAELELLVDQMRNDRITILPAVPSLLRILIEHPRFPGGDRLRYVWTGGEAVPPSLPKQIRAVSTARFFNFYGPTETSVEASAAELTNHDPSRPVPIGLPTSGMEVLVVDNNLQPVPATVPGELLIAGQGVANGYLNQPELTAKKFIDFPPGSPRKRKAYLTGDRGRWNAHGQLEFLGRVDEQIKLHGYRIELGEIEAALQAHSAVDRAAVKLIEGQRSSPRMVAFVSLLPKEPAAGDDQCPRISSMIRRHLLAQLPSYKVPGHVVVMDELPTTAGGKVDKRRLPDEIPEDVRPAIEPANKLEQFLVEAWSDVLGVESISVDQNFFEAGGNSLQAAVVTARLSQQLGVHVPTALIFDLADISQVAQRLIELYPEAMAIRFGVDLSDAVASKAGHPLLATFTPCASEQRLFMVHPPGGIVACYRELALHLKETQLIALRSRGLHTQEDLPASLSSMATEYIEAIKTVQPNGPYDLGGWSLGGLVAYEMAQQLRTAGEAVRRLYLLDTTIPAGSTDLVVGDGEQAGWEYGIDFTLDELAELPPEEQLRFLWEHVKKLGVLEENAPPEVVQSVLQDLQELFHHHVELTARYKISPVDVPISLFRPRETPVPVGDRTKDEPEDRGWRKLSPSVEVRYVPGHHHSMVQQPQVAELANWIARSLPATR